MSQSKKRIVWGHIWTTRSEDLDECVELWWPSLGREWTEGMLRPNFEDAKRHETVGKTAKIKAYRVIFEEIEV